MKLHFFSAKRLSLELAANAIGVREQAAYTAIAGVAWLLPFYLFIVPPFSSSAPYWFYTMWTYQGLTFVFLNIAGPFYCLRRCRVDPARNFLIDFTCLSAPVSVTTIIVGWASFHLLVRGAYAIVSEISFSEEPPQWLSLMLSGRFVDVLIYITSVGILAVSYIRVAHNMDSISRIREAASQVPRPQSKTGVAYF
jgi:hypothetical protein